MGNGITVIGRLLKRTTNDCLAEEVPASCWQGDLELGSKNEPTERLASALAHDFASVLSTVQRYTDALLRQEPVTPGQRSSIMHIDLALREGMALTEQLRSYSEKRTVGAKVWDFSQLVAAAAGRFERLIPSNIVLIFEPASELLTVRCDSRMFDQVVANLISNALEAMTPDGGQLRISTELASIEHRYVALHPEARPGTFASLSITDTGCGMDPATIDQLFKPFFTTKRESGRGLGLSKVYGIVKLHHGWTEVNSEAGAGSTVRVFLPLAQQRDTARRQGQSHQPEREIKR